MIAYSYFFPCICLPSHNHLFKTLYLSDVTTQRKIAVNNVKKCKSTNINKNTVFLINI